VRIRRSFFMVFLAGALTCGSATWAGDLEPALKLLDEGDYAAAQQQFASLAEQAGEAGDVLEQAVALKWQGVSLARLGHRETLNATNRLWQAVSLLEPLAATDQDAASELGFSLFSIAETLRVSAEHTLREQRVAGTPPSAYFSIVQHYMEPAEAAIVKARQYYAGDRLADLSYAQGEHALLMVRLRRVFLPGSSTDDGYDKAFSFYADTLRLERARGVEARRDVIVAATIRLAEIGKEQASQAGEEIRRAALDRGIQQMEAVRMAVGDQTEPLAHLLYTIATFRMDRDADFSADTAAAIEADLLEAAELIERERGKVSREAPFDQSGDFFSRRTHVYEALCRLYAEVDDADKFLLAIERMRARAFRDILSSDSDHADPDLDRLRARLVKDNAAFVEFFYGPEKAWAVQGLPGRDFEIVELPVSGQELALEIRKVIREFATPRSRGDWRRLERGIQSENAALQMKEGFRAANRLYRLLFESLVKQSLAAGVERLYWVPHHTLHYLSVASLVTEIDEQDLMNSRYLVEIGLPLVYLPTCAILARTDEASGGEESHVFYRTDFCSVAPDYPAPLPGTVGEAQGVAAITGARIYGENEATEQALRSLSGPYRLLHFATHGVLDRDDPLETRILLAATDTNNPAADGNLTVRELFQDLKGKLKADLVVLSACHTNESEPVPASGDDLAALSRGFIVAGARSVLATQWQASDAVFPVIMSFFLEEWHQQGKPKDVALALSQRRFLDQKASGAWRHPHFWGSLILMGQAE